MPDRGFSLSLRAVRRQLAAMPCERYLVRLIHHPSRKALPGQRLWTASQLTGASIVGFLRARNREGYDVYFQPYAPRHNAGYILLDLDHAPPTVLSSMRDHGHEPCVVIETSPGHLQAWVQVNSQPLAPALATAIARQLARLYQGDLASADWRHVGRLAGFTNQKPQRRLPSGWPPWVQVRYAQACLAANGHALLEHAWPGVTHTQQPSAVAPPGDAHRRSHGDQSVRQTLTPHQAAAIYQTWLGRLRIPQRFPDADWSIADLWIAKELLLRRTPAAEVQSILRLASPQFPRRHAAPEDYLRRTLQRAARDVAQAPFPARANDSPTMRIDLPNRDPSS